MSLVETLLSDASFDEGWSLIERFAILVRESGSTDERAGAHFVVSRLEALDIPYKLYEPDLYLSVPRAASVEMAGETLIAKTPSFSASTPAKGMYRAADPHSCDSLHGCLRPVQVLAWNPVG